MAANRLLILDDDPGVLHFLAEVGRQSRYEVVLAGSGQELEATYEAFDPSLIILDLQYDQGDGIDVMAYLKEQGCQAPILLISGFDARVLETARRVGLGHGLTIVGTIVKPVPVDELKYLLGLHREPEPEEWTDELRDALDRDEIVVFYQPKVDVADGRLVGFEALARWSHPVRGTLGPDHFIPLAEASGLIAPLTDRVLSLAAADCADWAAAGRDMTVAVNVSPAILMRGCLLEQLVELLARHSLPTTCITLEVTESAAMQDPRRIMELLTRLRLRGFNLALDDFGTGYSNLGLLQRMPFNELKIDKSFVADVKESRDSQAIVRALAGLARQLGMATVAEGVEDLEIREWLHTAGVEQMQGYGIARPMPAEQALAWMSAYAPAVAQNRDGADASD